MLLKILSFVCLLLPVSCLSSQSIQDVLNKSYKQTPIKKGIEESAIAISRVARDNNITKRENIDQKQRILARMGKNYFKLKTIYALKKNNQISVLIIGLKNNSAKTKLLNGEIKIYRKVIEK